MRILVDADFLVALAKKDDSNHKKAIALAEKLAGSFFFVTQFTIPEATTVLSYKVSQNSAKIFLNETRKMNLIELPFAQNLSESTDSIFNSSHKKGTSWIDCLNIAYVKNFQLDGILSFDKFYKKNKIKVFSN